MVQSRAGSTPTKEGKKITLHWTIDVEVIRGVGRHKWYVRVIKIERIHLVDIFVDQILNKEK